MGISANLEISSGPLVAAWQLEKILLKSPDSSAETLRRISALLPQLPADFALTQTQAKVLLEIASVEVLVQAEHLLSLTPAAAVDLLGRSGGADLLLTALRRSGDSREQARKNFTLLVERVLPSYADPTPFLPFVFSTHSVLEISSAVEAYVT
jgi:hypothetical protein